MELYKRIKKRREELGMSQQELATKMGYKSRSSINKIELGENDIPQSKIVSFAKALETTPEYLMGFEETFAELDLFEEAIAMIGWSYETLSDCNRPSNSSFEGCSHDSMGTQCSDCIHCLTYYYLTDNVRYYKLSESEFKSLSHCILSYLKFRINEMLSGKVGLTETEYKTLESLIDDSEEEYFMPAAAHNDTATDPEQQLLMAEDMDEL